MFTKKGTLFRCAVTSGKRQWRKPSVLRSLPSPHPASARITAGWPRGRVCMCKTVRCCAAHRLLQIEAEHAFTETTISPSLCVRQKQSAPWYVRTLVIRLLIRMHHLPLRNKAPSPRSSGIISCHPAGVQVLGSCYRVICFRVCARRTKCIVFVSQGPLAPYVYRGSINVHVSSCAAQKFRW